MLSSTVNPSTGVGSGAPLHGTVIALSLPGTAEDDAVLRGEDDACVVAVVRPFGMIPLPLASPPRVALPPAATDLPVITSMAAEGVGAADPAFATPERVFPLQKRMSDADPVPGAPKRQRLIRHLGFA